MEFWLEPFQFEFMTKAILVSTLIGGIGGLLSCFLTLKGWALMGDALSHSIFPGVVLCYILGWPMVFGAFIAGVLAVSGIGFIKNNTRIKEDAVMGVVFTTLFAIGLVLNSKFPSQLDLRQIMLGNLLGISESDLWQCFLIGIATLSIVLIKWKDLMTFCFDATHARSIGLPTAFLYYLLLLLLSLTTVAALQTVGAGLVLATLVTPGATAYLLTNRFGRMLIWAAVIGSGTALIGSYVSYFLNASVGGCIVVLQTSLFLLVFLFSSHQRFWKNHPAPSA